MAYRIIILMACIISCSRSPIMTREAFDAIHTGMTIAELESCVGKPYEICNYKDTGNRGYVYIERQERIPDYPTHYYYMIEIAEGRVVSKSYELVDPPRLKSVD